MLVVEGPSVLFSLGKRLESNVKLQVEYTFTFTEHESLGFIEDVTTEVFLSHLLLVLLSVCLSHKSLLSVYLSHKSLLRVCLSQLQSSII